MSLKDILVKKKRDSKSLANAESRRPVTTLKIKKTKLSLSGGSTTGAYAHPSPPWATTVRSIDNSDSRKGKFQKIGLQNSPQNAQNAFSHNLISFNFSGEHAPGLPPPP